MAKQWSDRIGRRLKLRDLHVMLAVANSGSMGKAASDLAVSQPAISKAIADLEDALGVPLLDRSPKGIEPTIYGRALLKCGTAVFDDLRQGVKEIEFLADPSAGELTIGCTEPLSAGFVSVVVNKLSMQYPKATFHVISADPVSLRNRELRQRHIDLALMPITGLALEQDIAVDPLFDDRHVVLAGGKNQWIRRRNIALADLIDEPWILPPPDTPVGSYIAAGFRAAGLEPPRAHVFTFSVPLYQHLLSTGRFLTTLPSSMVVHNRHLPLKLLPVKFPVVSRPVAIVTLKNRTLKPLARLFIDCARSLAEPLAKSSGDKREDGVPVTSAPPR
jgi:DNA-binding transcriptional LysR family regulator